MLYIYYTTLHSAPYTTLPYTTLYTLHTWLQQNKTSSGHDLYSIVTYLYFYFYILFSEMDIPLLQVYVVYTLHSTLPYIPYTTLHYTLHYLTLHSILHYTTLYTLTHIVVKQKQAVVMIYNLHLWTCIFTFVFYFL